MKVVIQYLFAYNSIFFQSAEMPKNIQDNISVVYLSLLNIICNADKGGKIRLIFVQMGHIPCQTLSLEETRVNKWSI